MRRSPLFAVVVGVVAAFTFATAITPRANYFGYRLYAFTPRGVVLERLRDAEERNSVDSDERRPLVDIWSSPHRANESAQVLVAPEYVGEFLALLESHQIDDIRLSHDNIQAQFNAEKNAAIERRRRRRRSTLMSNSPSILRTFDLHNYNSYADIERILHALAANRPEMVTLLKIGSTFEGREIFGVKITRPKSDKKQRPAIFIDAGIHAREFIAPAVALMLAEHLVMRYAKSESARSLLDAYDIFIVPVINADGYVWATTRDRLWRKTRSRKSNVSKWCIGADANRNFGYRWGEVGANRNPCSNIYAGDTPFSEIEAQSLRDFLTTSVPRLRVYASLHAFGQLFLSPYVAFGCLCALNLRSCSWGYTAARPANYYDAQTAAQHAVEAIKNQTGAVYTHGSIAELLYPASGTSIDFVASLDVPFVYGIELRPEDTQSTLGFSAPPSEIEPTAREMMAALVKIAAYASKVETSDSSEETAADVLSTD